MSPCYHMVFVEDLDAHLGASRQCDKCLLIVDSVSLALRVWSGRRTERADIRVGCHGRGTSGVSLVARDTELRLWWPWVDIAWVYSTTRHAHLRDDAPHLLWKGRQLDGDDGFNWKELTRPMIVGSRWRRRSLSFMHRVIVRWCGSERRLSLMPSRHAH